jgi:YegS/Rv2252/BmrU family lipid kinase
MIHLFIINPAAGSRDRTEQYRESIERICGEKGLDCRIAVSEAPGDCRRLAREAALSGKPYRLYACGGDGTLNEVASGAAGFDNVAVTVFSGGSGNDFVKLFSDRDAFRDLDRLLDAETATFDLIDCNGYPAVNICCVGLDSRIGAEMARFKRLPGVSGSMAYILSTVVNLFKGISEHYIVEVDGERIDGEMTFVCVANARYYGGGFYAVPDAQPDAGLLDILIVKKLHLWQIPNALAKYKAGRYKELGHVARHIRTDRITIRCDRDSPINLDGEIRTARNVQMKIADKKIRFFYPKGLHYEAE